MFCLATQIRNEIFKKIILQLVIKNEVKARTAYEEIKIDLVS